jgi:ArsR family transcriptional regulator
LTKPSYFYITRMMETKSAVRALAALAQETRLSIFRLLVQAGPQGIAVGHVGETLAVPAATLSFHLKELANAGLTSSRHEGRYIYHSVDYEHMAALMSFLTENCCQGMPAECLSVMELALGGCCPSQPKRKPARSKA